MEAFFDFLRFIVIMIAIVIIIFLVLLSLPKSKLRDSLLKLYSVTSYVVAAISAIYVISPIDAIPDVIPIAGHSDDLVALVSAIVTAVSGYISWKKSQTKTKTDASH